eukprot:jgi/Tetstr1/463094/TSEL_008028.t1
MHLCAAVAHCLAACHRTLHRQPVVDMLCADIHTGGRVRCHDDPPTGFRTKLAEAVIFLCAREAVAPVRKAFAANVINDMMRDSYTDFLGLPVDRGTDKVGVI